MSEKKNNVKDDLLAILKLALEKETYAFNYYSKTAVTTAFKEARILLTQLAEEERNHRRLIKHEIQKIEELIEVVPDNESFSSKRIPYEIPVKIPFKDIPTLPGIDAAAVSLPLEFLSGDLLEVMVLPGRDSMAVFLCDVMGHGVSPSLIESNIRKALGDYFDDQYSEDSVLATDEVMSFMNKKAAEMCSEHCRFITAIYGVLSLSQNKFAYTSAGHDTPIIIKNDRTYYPLKKTELILGADSSVDYSSTECTLEPGDIIAMYSDGVTEVVQENSRDSMYERERLTDTIRTFAHLPAKEIIENVISSLKTFSGETMFSDDMSLIVIKIGE